MPRISRLGVVETYEVALRQKTNLHPPRPSQTFSASESHSITINQQPPKLDTPIPSLFVVFSHKISMSTAAERTRNKRRHCITSSLVFQSDPSIYYETDCDGLINVRQLVTLIDSFLGPEAGHRRSKAWILHSMFTALPRKCTASLDQFGTQKKEHQKLSNCHYSKDSLWCFPGRGYSDAHVKPKNHPTPRYSVWFKMLQNSKNQRRETDVNKNYSTTIEFTQASPEFNCPGKDQKTLFSQLNSYD